MPPRWADRGMSVCKLSTVLVFLLHSLSTPANASPAWQFSYAYPSHYVALALGPSQSIDVDGSLSDDAWNEVPWTDGGFEDIAQPLYPKSSIPETYQTRVKVRWDADFLYIAAELNDSLVMGSITGHNEKLTNGKAPWWDPDFEVFVDVSGTTHWYKEYEMNVRNATYDVLWRVPTPGFNSPGVPCSQTEPYAWCTNSTYSHQNWTMKANNTPTGVPTPLAGLTTGTGHGTLANSALVPWLDAERQRYWTVEMAFPIRGAPGLHGGLLDADDSVDFSVYDPNNAGADIRYWWMNFARSEHPISLIGASALSSSSPASMCAEVQQEFPTLLGTGPYSCYWEWVWQHMEATRYMHNPEMWGMVQFARNKSATLCQNIEFPARYAAAQLHRAQVQFATEHGYYADNTTVLLSPRYCNYTATSCDLKALQVTTSQSDVFSVSLTSSGAMDCVDYRTGNYTGGPCQTIGVTLMVPGSECKLQAVVREDRYTTVERSEGCAGMCLEADI